MGMHPTWIVWTLCSLIITHVIGGSRYHLMYSTSPTESDEVVNRRTTPDEQQKHYTRTGLSVTHENRGNIMKNESMFDGMLPWILSVVGIITVALVLYYNWNKRIDIMESTDKHLHADATLKDLSETNDSEYPIQAGSSSSESKINPTLDEQTSPSTVNHKSPSTDKQKKSNRKRGSSVSSGEQQPTVSLRERSPTSSPSKLKPVAVPPPSPQGSCAQPSSLESPSSPEHSKTEDIENDTATKENDAVPAMGSTMALTDFSAENDSESETADEDNLEEELSVPYVSRITDSLILAQNGMIRCHSDTRVMQLSREEFRRRVCIEALRTDRMKAIEMKRRNDIEEHKLSTMREYQRGKSQYHQQQLEIEGERLKQEQERNYAQAESEVQNKFLWLLVLEVAGWIYGRGKGAWIGIIGIWLDELHKTLFASGNSSTSNFIINYILQSTAVLSVMETMTKVVLAVAIVIFLIILLRISGVYGPLIALGATCVYIEPARYHLVVAASVALILSILQGFISSYKTRQLISYIFQVIAFAIGWLNLINELYYSLGNFVALPPILEIFFPTI